MLQPFERTSVWIAAKVGLPPKTAEKAKAAGVPTFKVNDLTVFSQDLGGKKPAKGYGCQGDHRSAWLWFER
jgi:hypothetical protein